MLRLLTAALLALLPGLAFAAPAGSVDPRAGGVTIALGEWSVVPEAPAIRPGRVTFVVTNRGEVVHGFRIKQERDGGKGGDRVEARGISLRPGQTGRLTMTLPAGTYSIECFVEGHDDLGMERVFRVGADAPLVAPTPRAPGGTAVRIESFAFRPGTLRTKVGATVKWTNTDPAPHTVTSTSGAPLSSPQLGKGRSFTHRFDRAGTFAYLCAIHPAMKGRVIVSRP
jgi:plastocyanin